MRRSTTIALLAVVAALAAACRDAEADKRRYLESGNRLAAEKRYVEAILEYRNALQIDERFGDARVRLAETLAASGNPEGAYREYQRAADLLPDDPDVQKRAATLLFMAGQYQDVRARTLELLKKNPKDLDAQLLYANALVGLKDLEGGVREIEEAIQVDPAHAASYTNLAMVKLAQGQRDSAAAAFKKAVELDPKSLKARLALIYFELAIGNAAGAEVSLKEALALEPQNSLANRTLAALYTGTGRDASAEQPLKLVADTTKTAAARLALADYYLRRGRAADARSVLEPMLADAQAYPDAQMRLSQLAYAGDKDKAQKMLDALIAKYPGHAPSLLLKARWLFADGRPAQALGRATAAVNVAPRNVSALYFRGVLQAEAGQRDAAAKSFNDVLRLNPRAVAAQLQLSQLSLREGRAENAVEMAQEALANQPNSPEARLVLARALVAQRDMPRAEAEIARLRTRFPNASGVNALSGTFELLKGNQAAARTAFQQAFDADPSSIGALGGLTLLDLQQRRVAEARARIDKRLAATPKRVEVLVIAAKVYVADGNLARAEQLLRQVLELDPMLPDPYVILTDIYRTLGRMEAARGDFDAMVERNGADVGARTMGAVLVHAQGKQGDAKRRYSELLALDPRAATAANNLAWIYADEKQNLDVALQLAERATELLPDYAEAWDTLGWVYQRKQLPLLAIAPFEKALQRDPNNATFHLHLGMALAGAGDREKGRESLQMALKLQPDFPEAQREIQALQR